MLILPKLFENVVDFCKNAVAQKCYNLKVFYFKPIDFLKFYKKFSKCNYYYRWG